MRQLVYRVQPLPAAMLPLVWDFGQLDPTAENVYILQLLSQRLRESSKERAIAKTVPIGEEDIKCIGNLLALSQGFMRAQNDECSFVSIRDVERVIKVTSWFLKKRELIFTRMLNKRMDDFQTGILWLHFYFVLFYFQFSSRCFVLIVSV